MTRKEPQRDDPKQSKRFEDAAREVEAAGELSPTVEGLERTMRGVAKLRQEWFASEDEDSECPPSGHGQPES